MTNKFSIIIVSFFSIIFINSCVTNPGIEEANSNQTVTKNQKLKKKYKNRNSIDHQKKSNILVKNLATNNAEEQDLGINKISKLQLECTAKVQCAMLIKQKIINLWVFPKSYPKFKTILGIELTEQGNITTIRLKRTSGRRDFDDSVLKAVRQAAPFVEITYLPVEDIAEFSSIEMVFKR